MQSKDNALNQMEFKEAREMGWRLGWDAVWQIDIPVFKFDLGSEVATKIGIEGCDGVLRIFYVQLNELKGIREYKEVKKE